MGMFAEFAWSRSNRLLIALAYCNAFAALGACLAAFGPVLLELAIQTNASLRDTGYCFIVRSFGYFLGSFTGILYDHLPGNLVLGSVVVVAGAASAIIPHINNVMVLGGVVLFQGAGMGACDTGANLMLIYLYGSDVAPYMQLLHASFAVGAFSSPLLLRAVEGSSDTHTHTGLAGAGSYAPAFYLIAMYTMAVGLGVLFLKSPRSRTGASTRDVASSSSSSSGFAVAGDKGAVDAVSSNGHGDASGPAAGNGNEVVMVLQETGQNHHMGQLPLALQPLSMPLGGDVTAGGNVGNNNGLQRGPPVVFATLAGREHDNAALHASSNISTPDNGLTQADAAATAAWSSSDAPFSAQLESLSSVSTSSGSTLPGGYSSGDSGSGDSSANNSVAGSVMDHPPQLPAGFNVGREVWIAVAIVAVFLGIYVGMETGFGGFVTSFGVISLGMTEGEGQLLAGAYWGSIMLGRIAAIYLSTVMTPGLYLGYSVAGCIASCGLLLVGSSQVSVIWIASILFGLFMSAIFPLALSFAEACFPVRGTHATAFIVGSATGEMLLPAVIATLFGAGPGESAVAIAEGTEWWTVGPNVMLWTVSIAGVVNALIFVLMYRRGMWLKGVLGGH